MFQKSSISFLRSLSFIVVLLLSLFLQQQQHSPFSFFVSGAHIVPTCRLHQKVTAGNLRSVDSRGVLIDVIGDWTNFNYVPNARDVELMNKASNISNTQSAFDPTKKITVESIFLVNDTTAGSIIAITFKRLPNYWLGKDANDTVSINLPSRFFWSGIPCKRFIFSVLPSAGSIDTTFLPTTGVSEIDINDNDVSFDLYVNFDQFISANVWFANPVNFSIITAIPAPNHLRITVLRNQTYNPPFGHIDKFVVIFHKYMMKSGVAPIIGDGISQTEVFVNFIGVDPVASVVYQNPSAGAMLSEDLWDGLAWAILVLKGDTFNTNASVWALPGFEPTYTAAKPVSPYGFDYFFKNQNMTPSYNISSRQVNLTFPPLVGFAIPNVVDQMKMGNVGQVTTEQRTIQDVPFRVLRVKDSSPIITFNGTPWTNHTGGFGVSEVDVRRIGINMSLTLKYNVWVNPPAASLVRTMIASVTSPTTSSLIVISLVDSVYDRTRLDLFLPPQTSYDISATETFSITVFSGMTETRQLIPNNVALFNVSQFTGASQCTLKSPNLIIYESDIRNVTGPDLDIYVNISSGNDKFCFSPSADVELRQSMTVTSGSGSPGPPLVVDYISNTSTNITMRIRKNPTYEITGNVYLSVTLPASMMCSLEICVSEQAGGAKTAKLLLPIGATNGILVGDMPRVSEEFMRTQTLSAVISFIGDAFKLTTVGSTRGFILVQNTVTPDDPYQRGFLASFPQDVRRLSIDGNLSRGDFVLAPNASYDIVNEETITFQIVSVRTASQVTPISQVVPLRIYPLLGILNVVYPNLTALALLQTTTTTTAAPTTSTTTTNMNSTVATSTTTSTTTAAPTTTTTTTTPCVNTTGNCTGNVTNTTTPVVYLPWEMWVKENEILNGNITINMTLANDRFNRAILAQTIRNQLTVEVGPGQPSGIQANKAVIFANSAFYFDNDEFFMSIKFQKAPAYDITVPESFTIYFNGSILISGQTPLQNRLIIHVQPDPGRLTMTGDALLISSFNIVNGFRSYSIMLNGDKFVVGATSIFNRSELCVVTVGNCEIILDESRRNITVTYDPYRDFFISRNTTWTIQLHPQYFDANITPVGGTNVTVYLSGGKLEWFLTLTRVSEDAVRSGSYPNLAADAPIAKASISGDKFAAKEEVRRSLAESVVCVSADKNLVGQDPYGFCSRSLALFGSIFFKIEFDNRVVDVVLQPDDQFDIYAEETVTFVASGGATQSRLAPIVAGKDGILVIYPTQGKYFISTSFVYITEQDISSPALAATMKLSISLYGERWLANVTRAVELVVSSMVSNVGTKEINGWTRYRSSIFPAQTAGTIDTSGRLLELQFVAAQKYDVFNPETITISVDAGAVLSSFAPALASVQSGFTIDTVGGILTGFGYYLEPVAVPNTNPTEYNYVFRVANPPTVKLMKTFGFNVSLNLARDTWDELNLFTDWSLIYNAFTSDRTPQEEPNGFAVHKQKILAPKDPIVPVPGNASSRSFLLNSVPEYDLINPETIRVDMALIWTQQGNGGKATTPSYFTIMIMPEFPAVQAVVKCYSNLTNVNDTAAKAYLQNWITQVAQKLDIIPSRIEIESIIKEPKVPDSSPYYRIYFKIKDITDPNIPYDNTVTRLFVSWDRGFLEKYFNTSFAFFERNAPPDKQFLTLEGAGGIHDNTAATGMSLTNIVFFVIGIIVALLIIFFIRRWQQGKYKNGLNWGESEGRQKADARFADTHEMEERNFDKAAELLFAGQREMVPYLADDDAARIAKEEADKKAYAAKHGIDRSAQVTAATATITPNSQGYLYKTQRPTGDGRDELAFFDVPENLYSGQSAVTKRATDADVGMSLIDRMVTQGTDHSTRISKRGNARIQNLTDLMSPRETEMASKSYAEKFVSPSEIRDRDPILFGSERRINDLLSRVGGGGGAAGAATSSAYMTQLRTNIIDSGVTPFNDKNSANSGPKLWNDSKADDIVLPPHLVGKVSRFRPPTKQ